MLFYYCCYFVWEIEREKVENEMGKGEREIR